MRLNQAIVVASILCAAGAARAELIQYTFTGSITSITEPQNVAPEFAEVASGDPFTVRYIFEATAPDQNPANTTSGLYGGVMWASITIGAASISGDTGSQSWHAVNFGEPGFEEFETSIELLGNDLQIDLDNNTDTPPFATDALPGLALPFDLLASSRLFSLSVILPPVRGGFFGDINGTIAGFQSEVVPTPGAAALAMLAVSASFRRRRKL
jgi:uncharacterized protein (TIGR03382 family)